MSPPASTSFTPQLAYIVTTLQQTSDPEITPRPVYFGAFEDMTVDNRRENTAGLFRVDGLIRGQRHHHHRRIGLGDPPLVKAPASAAQRGSRIRIPSVARSRYCRFTAPNRMFDRRADTGVSQTFNNGVPCSALPAASIRNHDPARQSEHFEARSPTTVPSTGAKSTFMPSSS